MRTSSAPTMRVTKSLGRSRISCGFEPFAKNRGHGAGKRLLRTERHANARPAVFIHVEISADRVRAVLALTRLLLLRVVRVRNKCLAPLILGKQVEEIDDLV
jgi:hypothetical protein